jgi:hypothetical protein
MDIIQVGRCSATTAGAEFTGLLQIANGGGVRGMTIDVDDPRRGSAAGQGQPQEHLRRDQVAFGRQHDSPAESTARYRQAQLPPTFTYVSSTLQDRFGRRNSRRIR